MNDLFYPSNRIQLGKPDRRKDLELPVMRELGRPTQYQAAAAKAKLKLISWKKFSLAVERLNAYLILRDWAKQFYLPDPSWCKVGPHSLFFPALQQ